MVSLSRQVSLIRASGIAAALCLTQVLSAIPIGIAAFSGDEFLIDFETILSEEPITNQLGFLGIVFEPGLFGDPAPASTIQGTMEATNFNGSITNPIAALFDEPQFRVGFLVAGSDLPDGQILLRALLGEVLVGEFTFTTDEVLPGGSLPSVFAGLEVPGGFNRIEISRLDGNGAFSIDDLRFEIPAPGSLLSFGLFLTIGRRRRS